MNNARSHSFWHALICVSVFVPAAALADSGFYIGAGAGGATVESDLVGLTIPDLPASLDEDDTAIKVFAGYRFDLPVIDLALEGGYVDFGEADVDTLGNALLLDTTGIHLWGVASLDAGLVDIFGKLGYIVWEVEADFLDASASDDGADIGYGLGIGFGAGPLQLRSEYEIYDLDGTDVTMISVSLAYRFD